MFSAGSRRFANVPRERKRTKNEGDIAITPSLGRQAGRLSRESFASAVFDKAKPTRKSSRNVWSDKLPRELFRTFQPRAKPIGNSRGYKTRANLPRTFFLSLSLCLVLYVRLFFLSVLFRRTGYFETKLRLFLPSALWGSLEIERVPVGRATGVRYTVRRS